MQGLLKVVERNFHSTAGRLKVVPSNLKTRSKSSHEWITRQLNDPYVKAAREMDFRARSAFKLIEIDDKLKFLKPGIVAVEAGAAPGAWTQVVVNRINSDGKAQGKAIGRVVGVDLLPVAPLEGANFIQCCDFTSVDTQQKIISLLSIVKTDEISPTADSDPKNSRLVDLMLSDMAPNASGTSSIDHERIIILSKHVLKFALQYGKVGSNFLTKVWDGSDLKAFENCLLDFYKNVKRVKPKASRSDSSEIYLFAQNLKNINKS